MNLPNFQPWVHWDKRCSVADCHRPGIYLLRHFDHSPPSEVDPLEAPLIYVGETCDQSLEKRWYDFNRSAYLCKNGHSGGWTFNNLFCADQPSAVHPWLYVAALPIHLEGQHLSAYIRFVERWIIWAHVERHGTYPRCNKK